ncbi:MAG: hypothetical protein KAI79_00220 [Bacteroidales bacterium]|nr:hypothetical protein [Bacteroidales bacterium]
MKSKSKSTRTLQILASVGAALYLFFIAMTIFYDSYPIFKPFDLKEALLLIFIVGFALAWTNKKMATGVVFMIWNAGIWIDDLYLNRPEMDYSMISAMASCFMLIGAFFLLEWYKTSKETVPSEQKQWKFILRVLLINYAVLYFIVVFSELSVGESVNYFSFPFIIYPLLLLIFLVSFLLSWKREFIVGYIFLFWFAILIYSNIAYSEILHLGGWALFGLPILLQGIFYINNHNKFRLK